MKFVGSIKGKPYLIDPETFEQEIRTKIAGEIRDMVYPSHTHYEEIIRCHKCDENLLIKMISLYVETAHTPAREVE